MSCATRDPSSFAKHIDNGSPSPSKGSISERFLPSSCPSTFDAAFGILPHAHFTIRLLDGVTLFCALAASLLVLDLFATQGSAQAGMAQFKTPGPQVHPGDYSYAMNFQHGRESTLPCWSIPAITD